MPILSIENSHLKIEISPEAGGSIVACAVKTAAGAWLPVMRPTPPEAIAELNSSLMASFTLLPYSNRLRDARFRFNGQTHQLRPNTPEGYAIHGDVRKRPWQVAETSAQAATLTFDSRHFSDINFPFPFNAQMVYAVVNNRFDTTLSVTNSGGDPMPVGMGFHPYFQRSLSGDPADEVHLQANVSGVYPELVPVDPAIALTPEQDFSTARPLGGMFFDHCFAGWDGRATLHWPQTRLTATFICDATLEHLILFTPPRLPFFALEPVSNANNGFNLHAAGYAGSGVQVLTPEQTLTARFQLAVTWG